MQIGRRTEGKIGRITAKLVMNQELSFLFILSPKIIPDFLIRHGNKIISNHEFPEIRRLV